MLYEKVSFDKLHKLYEIVSHVILTDDKKSLVLTFKEDAVASDIGKLLRHFHILLAHRGEKFSYFSTTFRTHKDKELTGKKQLIFNLNPATTKEISETDIVGMHLFKKEVKPFKLK